MKPTPLLDALMAEGVIWFDDTDHCYVGRCPVDGVVLTLSSYVWPGDKRADVKERARVETYLQDYPPERW